MVYAWIQRFGESGFTTFEQAPNPKGRPPIIADGMTGLTGWDVAERIRAGDPHVPVVFITGWGLQAEDRERCRKLGILNVLFKPVRPPPELHQAVQEALAVSTRKSGGSAP